VTPPTLDTLTPPEAPPDGVPIDVMTHGSLFQSGAVVVFGGGEYTPSFFSTTRMVITVSLTMAGAYSVMVRNPDGGESNVVTFEAVTPVVPPVVPLLTSLAPDWMYSYLPGTTITCTGEDFVDGAVVVFDGT